MPDGSIVVDYATIHRAAEDCTNTTKALEHAFNQLKDDLKPLVNSWDGSAKIQYDHAQTQWDQKFDDLRQLLAQIASALPQIADGYQSTDNKVQGLF